MTDGERRLLAEHTATVTADKLAELAKDRKFVGEVLGVWSDEMDKSIGRGLRRGVVLLALALAGGLGVKYDWLGKIFALIK